MKQGRAKAYLKGTRRYNWTGKIPMEKLLRSRKGQQWDKIYSEFSKEFKHGTEAGNRFFDTLKWEVKTGCWKGADSGTIFDEKGQEVHGWFVNPMNGCLDFKELPKRKKETKPLTEIKLADGSYYKKEDGIWYHMKYGKEKISYSNEYPCIQKRQLTSHQLKAAGIHNDSKEDQDKAKEDRKKREKDLYLSGLYYP